jgi:hypothetical protein
MLDQHSIVLDLYKKGLSPKEISNDPVATVGSDGMEYCTVVRDAHDAKCTHPKVTSPPDTISRQFDESDQGILFVLEE